MNKKDDEKEKIIVLAKPEDVQEKRMFSDAELVALAGDLAKAVYDKDAKESAKKSAVAQYSGEIKKLTEKIADLMQKVQNRYEYIWVPYTVKLNFSTHERMLHDAKTGAFVRSVPFTPEDYRLELPNDIPVQKMQEGAQPMDTSL